MALFSGKKDPQGFSFTLSGEAQIVAQALYEPKKLTRFRSAPQCQPGGTNTRWLEASKITSQWAVIRHEQMADKSWQETPVMTTPYFFDALYEVARFETSELGLVSAAVTDETAPHYKKVADAAAVPLDTIGLPHPAAGGVILTPGNFDDHAKEIAARTRDRKIRPRENNIQPGDFISPTASPDMRLTQKVELREQEIKDKAREQELKDTFRRLAKQSRELNDLVNRAVLQDFKCIGNSNVAGTVGTISTLSGIGGVVAASVLVSPAFLPLLLLTGVCGGIGKGCTEWIDDLRNKAEPFIASRQAKILSLAQKLPDGDEKNLTQEFAKAAKATFYLEYAAFVNESNGRAKPRELKKLKMRSMALVDEAAKAMQWPKSRADELKNALVDDTFPEQWAFYKELDAQHQMLQGRLKARLAAMP